MEVAEGKSSLKTNSRIESECIKNHHLQVDVKIERESDNEEETEVNVLYADHFIVIKEEMVIGPEVLQHPIYSSCCSKDAPPLKKPKLEKTDQEKNHHQKETATEIGTEEQIAASNTDELPHKKPRLMKQEQTADLQEETNNDIEGVTANVDSKIKASTYIQAEQEDKIERVTEKSKPIKRSKSKRNIQVKDKNVNRVMLFNVFTCNDCMHQTVTRYSLERHKTVHDPSRQYVCDVCGYRYKHKCKLKTHLRIVHSVKRIHVCSVCDYRTNNVRYLNVHLKIHTGEKRYSCTVCEYRCTRKSDLTNHIKIHTGEKPLSCTVCEYRCIHKSTMTNHMRIHSGEKPFSCTVCEFKCTQKSNLTNHMKIHSDEKPFSCSVCEYKCSHKSSLKNHTKIHTGEKPFTCTLCAYRCATKCNLTAHIKRIHNK